MLLDDQGRVVVEVGGFLLESGDRKILVDAGVGPYEIGPFTGGALLESLGSYGLAPTDITDVIFSHLHFDHVGWATRKGTIVFPNATYRCHELEWG